ncbi:hypothetical protein [Aminipila terrae]|uniref:Uncharacterized protein n=1 Tax=Aminipila terrae TaxID=2697030 RepID=A0A6P1MLK2_9FIRM|nr:hypothetical protein [Aminipila terrae]QHI73554.1 hypothetical protein Ami3637_15270 [Aminipila terrae]
MKLKSIAKRLSVLTMVGIVALAGAGNAFAADRSNCTQKNMGHENKMANFQNMSDACKSAIDTLVQKGTITQEQADAITASMPAKDGKTAFSGEKRGPFTKLVTDGTITQEQADAIMEAMKTAKDTDKTKTDILSTLVTAGTITQAQADAITASMPTRDSKTAFSGEKRGPFTKLVTEGTITQAQADAIMEAMKAAKDTDKTKTDVLSALITAGTITQAQADAITAGMPTKGDKTVATGEKHSPYSKLVADGTITQAQADALWDAVKTALDTAKNSEQ